MENRNCITDPLYYPYQCVAKECISPFKSFGPDVDPSRFRLGWGVRYRTQEDGIVMPDFTLGDNNMAYPKPVEGGNVFYSNKLYKTYPYTNQYPQPCVLGRNPSMF